MSRRGQTSGTWSEHPICLNNCMEIYRVYLRPKNTNDLWVKWRLLAQSPGKFIFAIFATRSIFKFLIEFSTNVKLEDTFVQDKSTVSVSVRHWKNLKKNYRSRAVLSIIYSRYLDVRLREKAIPMFFLEIKRFDNVFAQQVNLIYCVEFRVKAYRGDKSVVQM